MVTEVKTWIRPRRCVIRHWLVLLDPGAEVLVLIVMETVNKSMKEVQEEEPSTKKNEVVSVLTVTWANIKTDLNKFQMKTVVKVVKKL